MLPFVAREYGHISCASFASSSACSDSRPGMISSRSTAMSMLSSPERTSDTRAPTDEPSMVTFFARAALCRAEWKQAAYPAANSCSGLFPSPEPPSPLGGAISRSTALSAVAACPSRPPPVERASTVYSASDIQDLLGWGACRCGPTYAAAAGDVGVVAPGRGGRKGFGVTPAADYSTLGRTAQRSAA